MTITTIFVSGSPLQQLSETTNSEASNSSNPVTIIEWPGTTTITGACLVARINLQFINALCNNFATNLKVALQATKVLSESKLERSNKNQVQRFTYVCLKLENSFDNTIKYVDSLVLCSNETMIEVWDNYNAVKRQLNDVWSKLKLWENRGKTYFPEPTWESNIPTLIDTLETTRPIDKAPSQHFLGTIIALGVAFGAGALTTSLVGTLSKEDNEKQIKALNDNIHKVNKKIQITNERIDVLSENVTNAVNDIKIILDKIVKLHKKTHIYEVMIWNIEQLIETSIDTYHSFRLGEIIITMLESGILNADLIEITTFKNIITEGLTFFTNLKFPVEISKHTLPDIIKILEIRKIGHNNFIMVIPLVNKDLYKTYSLIPHPVNVESKTLVIAELDNVILVSKDNYIITAAENVHSFTKEAHMIQRIEPINALHRSTCEWESYNQNLTAMLVLCNYKKVGLTNGIYMTETRYYRIIYLTEKTQVELDCPDGRIRDTLEGLHKIPIQCDVNTDQVYWPSRQTMKIDMHELLTNIPNNFDATQLPITHLNNTK